MPDSSDEFYRIQKLPPYVFAVINEMRAKARAAQIDVIDLGMGNPDGATPRPIVNKLIEASRNARNHRYSQSRGIPKLREEITAPRTHWRTCCSRLSAPATRWFHRTPPIRFINTAC